MNDGESMGPRRRAAKRAAGLLALVLVAGGCRSAGPRSHEPYVLEIEERNRHLEEQFRRGNLLGVSDLYADDALLLDSHGERHQGRQAIDAYWTRIESPRGWRLETRRVFGSDTLAYEVGRWYQTTLREGQERTSMADFLLLWRRQADGNWKIELDAHWPAP